MKLEKYQDKNKKKRKVILISIGVIVLISVSLLLYKTFSSFMESAEFPMMNGKVDYFGNSDVYFVFYQGDKELKEMPQKDNKENLVFDHGTCDNGASIIWDSETWAPLVKNLSKSKTKCSLYFDVATPIVDYITNLAKTDNANLMYDGKDSLGEELGTDDNNLRYVGASPNNYIDIGDRDGDGKTILWRIIGVMNNIMNLEDGKQESLIKIMRSDSIGKYSLDSSVSSVNLGYGVNEWSQADAMKLINPKDIYDDESIIGGSLYWNKERGNCYNDENEANIGCDFTSSGLSETAKKKIAKVRWNTGTFGEIYNKEKINSKYMYDSERSVHHGKEQCENNNNDGCNDNISRTTTWDGYMGLIYPSDFGYAVGGDIRTSCLLKTMTSYTGDCGNNDWIRLKYGDIWTMTPITNDHEAYAALRVGANGNMYTDRIYKNFLIVPVAYLKSNTKIFVSSNSEKEYGSIDNPFRISL